MEFREAYRLARRHSTGQPKGSISAGQKVSWEDTKVRLVFVPDHAYTTEGRLYKTDLKTGKTVEL